MHLIKKLAALAAVAALSAPAFAYDLDLANYADPDTVKAFVADNFAAGNDLVADGNHALIYQEASEQLAHIEQSGATNLAAIIQLATTPSTATIFQIGESNRAYILQQDSR